MASEDRELFDRCLFFSQSGPPLIPGNYNNLYQIIQTPGYVTIYSEMAHQTRTVPIAKREKLPKDVTLPVPIYKPEPPYTQEARDAKLQGTVRMRSGLVWRGRARLGGARWGMAR